MEPRLSKSPSNSHYHSPFFGFSIFEALLCILVVVKGMGYFSIFYNLLSVAIKIQKIKKIYLKKPDCYGFRGPLTEHP